MTIHMECGFAKTIFAIVSYGQYIGLKMNWEKKGGKCVDYKAVKREKNGLTNTDNDRKLYVESSLWG